MKTNPLLATINEITHKLLALINEVKTLVCENDLQKIYKETAK